MNVATKIEERVVRAMVRAYAELNSIRARDGVPKGSMVDEEYFSAVVDEVDAAVRDLTGRGAHLHPALYRKIPDENHDQVR